MIAAREENQRMGGSAFDLMFRLVGFTISYTD
jgi:hypothetical protein